MNERLETEATRWAQGRRDVHALVLVGSRARGQRPADASSDHDFVIVVDDPGPFLASADWVAELGPWLLSFVEDSAVGGLRERRVLFADGADADFTFVSVAALGALRERPDVSGVLARGFRILVDKDALGELPTHAHAPAEDLAALTHEFWHRAIVTARKLRRGELFVAVQGANCALRDLLRRALELEARAAGRDPWHDGRFLEDWIAPEWADRLPQTIATARAAHVASAIRAACDLFAEVCEALRERHGLDPAVDVPAVRARLEAVLQSRSSGSTLAP